MDARLWRGQWVNTQVQPDNTVRQHGAGWRLAASGNDGDCWIAPADLTGDIVGPARSCLDQTQTGRGTRAVRDFSNAIGANLGHFAKE
jgi:hypothetical protein